MSGTVNESSGWRAVDDDAAEVARYLETASRLLAVGSMQTHGVHYAAAAVVPSSLAGRKPR
jgi:hypothetical protein